MISHITIACREHEGSRRMKTELLVQMDGLAKTDDLVFLLAASNLPWYVTCHFMNNKKTRRIMCIRKSVKSLIYLPNH